jgi:hypothetical protein
VEEKGYIKLFPFKFKFPGDPNPVPVSNPKFVDDNNVEFAIFEFKFDE